MSRQAPKRMCCGCRQRLPVSHLLRVDGRTAETVRVGAIGGFGARSGRGAYVCPTARCALRGMRRICRSNKVSHELGKRLLGEAVDSAHVLLDNRKNGLRRRGISGDDVATTALAAMTVKLSMAVNKTVVGA